MSQHHFEMWRTDPQFSLWLGKDRDGDKAFCKICHCSLGAHKSGLQKHSNTKYHREKENEIRGEYESLLKRHAQTNENDSQLIKNIEVLSLNKADRCSEDITIPAKEDDDVRKKKQ